MNTNEIDLDKFNEPLQRHKIVVLYSNIIWKGQAYILVKARIYQK